MSEWTNGMEWQTVRGVFLLLSSHIIDLLLLYNWLHFEVIMMDILQGAAAVSIQQSLSCVQFTVC